MAISETAKVYVNIYVYASTCVHGEALRGLKKATTACEASMWQLEDEIQQLC